MPQPPPAGDLHGDHRAAGSGAWVRSEPDVLLGHLGQPPALQQDCTPLNLSNSTVIVNIGVTGVVGGNGGRFDKVCDPSAPEMALLKTS